MIANVSGTFDLFDQQQRLVNQIEMNENPFTDYFIASSNSVNLSKKKHLFAFKNSQLNMYRKLLEKGCRCFERKC